MDDHRLLKCLVAILLSEGMVTPTSVLGYSIGKWHSYLFSLFNFLPVISSHNSWIYHNNSLFNIHLWRGNIICCISSIFECLSMLSLISTHCVIKRYQKKTNIGSYFFEFLSICWIFYEKFQILCEIYLNLGSQIKITYLIKLKIHLC